MRIILWILIFSAGLGTGIGGPILYRAYNPVPVAINVTPPASPLSIHPARPVSWWKEHRSPELAKMVPWCRDNDPGGNQYQDCRNATEALSQLQIETAMVRR